MAVARTAYETALAWAKTYTAGGPGPIMHYQIRRATSSGDVAAPIEACRYFCWKAAHYLDAHDYHGEMIGAMCKIHCTETDVRRGLQVHAGRRRQHGRQEARVGPLLREASLLPLYDAGNFGMQRRRVHGVMADPTFNPRAVMDDECVEFTKDMEGIDTIPGITDAMQLVA